MTTIRDLIDEKMDIKYETINRDDGTIIFRTEHLDVVLDEGSYFQGKILLLLEIAEKATLLHENEIPEEITAMAMIEAMDERVPANIVTACVHDLYSSIEPILNEGEEDGQEAE